jgi:hypothetical protein
MNRPSETLTQRILSTMLINHSFSAVRNALQVRSRSNEAGWSAC